MRLHAAFLPGRVPVTARLVLLAALVLGCDPGGPLPPFGVRQVAIIADSDTLRPGRSAVLRAVATAASGEVVDAPVVWRSLTPSTLSVDANGEVFARTPGIGVVRASVGPVIADRTLQLVNPPAVALNVQPDSIALTLPGGPVTPSVTPVDATNAPVTGATLTWQSEAPRIASVSSTGQITAVAIGRTTVRVSLDGVSRLIPVIVTAAASVDAPRVDSVVPRSLAPGVPFTVYGARLLTAGAQANIVVDGFAAQALTATSTQVTALLPTTTDACVPSGEAAVQVRTAAGYGAGPVRVQFAPRRSLAVGESSLLLTTATAGCLELPADGRYVFSVVHAGRALGAGEFGITLDVRSGREASATVFFAQATSASLVAAAPSPASAHLRVLERSLAIQPVQTVSRIATLQVPPVGGVVNVRVPDLDDARLCVGYRSIGARTVYDGTRIAILEDTATSVGGVSSLAGQMDAAIATIGAEVETVVWPLLERFGNPLVMDDRLDANGKVVLVLTPALNAMQGGAVMGAVVTCDFIPRAAAPASNVGEMLYLQVPDLRQHPDPAEALRVWRAAVRGTIAHELKHVVGFAERIARGQPLEESWLEEATARHAEELFARALTGVSATADAGYAVLRCENLALTGDATCADTPAMMRPTLTGLYRFLETPNARSPLGSRSAGDDSYYGSSWSLLRWAMDHAVLDETAFTRGLTTGGQSGVANLETRSGRSWDEMLARWSLTLLTDGTGAREAADPTLRLRGWRLGELFAGFCSDVGGCGLAGSPAGPFGRAHPALPMPLSSDVTVEIAEIAPGGFAAFELAPALAGSTRLLRLRGMGSAPLPQAARLALLRVE